MVKRIDFSPELRIYNQPIIATSEADIKTTLMSDKFIVLIWFKSRFFLTVRYQVKPFMLWIWLSVILISFGGIVSFFTKKIMKNKILPFSVIIIFGIIFFIFYKGLDDSKIYTPDFNTKKEIPVFNTKEFFS